MSDIKLSIVLLTYNRAEQLKEAIESCFDSLIPEKTEFVIVDNASVDNTREVVEKLFEDGKHEYLYKNMGSNTGVGPGRSEGYALARGKFVYFMDDDAIIPDECKKTFFAKSLEILESDDRIASLTTRIKDVVLQYDRHPDLGKGETISDCKQIFMYHGGSHFLRNGAFKQPLYMTIKYGFEEIYPSVAVFDVKMVNLYCDDVYIVHKPKINKWQNGSDQRKRIDMVNCYTPYAVKKRIYPKITFPVLYVFYKLRTAKHLSKYKGAKKESRQCGKELYKLLKEDKNVSKVKIKTVIRLAKTFGQTAL